MTKIAYKKNNCTVSYIHSITNVVSKSLSEVSVASETYTSLYVVFIYSLQYPNLSMFFSCSALSGSDPLRCI